MLSTVLANSHREQWADFKAAFVLWLVFGLTRYAVFVGEPAARYSLSTQDSFGDLEGVE